VIDLCSDLDDRENRWDLVLEAVPSPVEGEFWTTGFCVEGRGATILLLGVPDAPAESEDGCLGPNVV